MALGYRDDLPVAYEYNSYELPSSIRNKLQSGAVAHWREHDLNNAPIYEPLPKETLSRVASNDKVAALLARYVSIHNMLLSFMLHQIYTMLS